MSKSCHENVFFSPFSVSIALAMVASGAIGDTAAELREVLGFPDEQTAKTGFSSMLHSLTTTSDQFTLNSANGLYIDQSFSVLDTFRFDLTNYYHTAVTSVDFKNNPEAARTVVNMWVEAETKNKIRDLLPSGSVSSDTRLVLANAVYFKGTWDQKFNPALTRRRDFFVCPEQTVPTDMMVRKAKFPYTENDSLHCKMVELKYAGDRLVMYVILPDEKTGLVQLEQKLNADNFKTLRESLYSANSIIVTLPKFRMEIGSDLEAILKQMGIRKAFSAADADFSRVSQSDDHLFLSKVAHKAFVDVNEEGTVAAAATGLVINTLSLELEIPFTADHPFLFVIFDKLTDVILFLGRYKTPPANN